MAHPPTDITIKPWGPADGRLLAKLLGDPEMTTHLGGPESPEKLAVRQRKYERLPGTGTGCMYKIVDVATGEGVGSVGYWDRRWNGEEIYEMGWSVLTPYQRRGIAKTAVLQAIAKARSERRHRYVHAFPPPENPASNAVCRACGFELMGECDFEYPPGNHSKSNDWRLDLESS